MARNHGLLAILLSLSSSDGLRLADNDDYYDEELESLAAEAFDQRELQEQELGPRGGAADVLGEAGGAWLDNDLAWEIVGDRLLKEAHAGAGRGARTPEPTCDGAARLHKGPDPSTLPSKRAIVIMSCARAPDVALPWYQNSKHAWFAQGLQRHLGKQFSQQLPVYWLQIGRDWRVNCSLEDRVPGLKGVDVIQRVMLFCDGHPSQQGDTALADGIAPSTVAERRPELAGRTSPAGIYWHPDHVLRPLAGKDGLPSRGLWMNIGGEVFWERLFADRECSPGVDAKFYRSYGRGIGGDPASARLAQRCPLVQYFQAAQLSSERQQQSVYSLESRVAPEEALRKQKFAAWFSSSQSCRDPVAATKAGMPDALFRASFVDKLSQYRPVDSYGRCLHTPNVTCEPSERDNAIMDGPAECLRPYKFAVTMDNSFEFGYTSEKIFNGLFGKTVPIYFGAPNVTSIVNPSRFIYCEVQHEEMLGLRRDFYAMGHTFQGRPLREALDWFNERLGHKVDECVKKVIEVDQDPKLYEEMLTSPALRQPVDESELDGFMLAKKVHEVLEVLSSPLF